MISHHPLKLYVNQKWRRLGVHTMLLNPWWGNPYDTVSVFAKQMFDAYSPDIKYYTITEDITIADMVLVPYPYTWFLKHGKPLFNECVEVAKNIDLPLLIDGMGDIEYPINIKNAYIMRYGGYRFLNERGSVHMPLCTNDLLQLYKGGCLEIREKKEGKPAVGFSGWAELSPQQYLRAVVKEVPLRVRGIFDARYRACVKGIFWRKKAIKVLRGSSQVLFNLRVRKSFSANLKTAEDDMEKLRREMVDTILRSDYALDVRGDANNSARLFEILSLGRIPVILDTERNFPFRDKIDYSSFSLIIDFR